MTLTEFDLSELLEAIKAGELTERIRASLEWILQELIEAEATARIGAGRYERSEERTTQRNGYRRRLLSTPAGDVELGIPKLRAGSFFPSLLKRRRRIDRALFAVVMEAYVQGVSTRRVDELVKALGVASGISKSEVSRIFAGLDKELEEFRNRPLDHVEFPYVFADATYVKGRVRGRVVSRAVVVATSVTAHGDREVLGIEVGDTEDKAFWVAFFKGLRARGLGGVQLVISDHHLGLKEAIASVFVGAAWQRCRVHFLRINRPSGVEASGHGLVCCWRSLVRCRSMLLATRSWRAASSAHPRLFASSRRARTSSSCSLSSWARPGSGTKLSHCSQMLA